MSILNNILPGIDTFIPLLNPAVWLYLPSMQCNFRCAYCYTNRCADPRGDSCHSHSYSLPGNLSKKSGWIFLYGGEPLSDKKLLYSLIQAIRQHGVPEYINSDQGVQYTSKLWIDTCISFDTHTPKGYLFCSIIKASRILCNSSSL